ncbi:hypothetical protein HPB51_000350 [Rhipicephalus microplus]|uniref:DUF7041 domain-containing protein n=1 Tax=Rhipicephalus microplus TaxID=6941 RepID=A0A9J6D465_RHIMP|nr:hypothetical protein HPB51_000350 [Rhipicephalus microplus]
MHLSMEVTGTTDHDVSAIFFRIPVYGDRNLSIWFSQAESPFILSGVRTEQRKYHLVVSALSPAAGEEISDLLFGPPSTTSYSTLKAAVLERTTASQCSRIEELLSAEELGGRLPSQLHRHMRQLISSYTTTTEENLLRELFLQSLSDNVQMILATASTLSLNGLATLVDKVLEVVTPFVCSVMLSFNNVSDAPQTPSDPASPIGALCDRIEQLVCAAERCYTTSRHRNRSRNCPHYGRAQRSRSPEPPEIYYYHRCLGQEAHNCLQPCSWHGKRISDH